MKSGIFALSRGGDFEKTTRVFAADVSGSDGHDLLYRHVHPAHAVPVALHR